MSGESRPDALRDACNAVLPQTQCRRCGYSGCLPYAEAMAVGEADVNLCPPGGEHTRVKLANLLDQELVPPRAIHPPAKVTLAEVVEADCIGCTKCIQACPMDAIVGAAGLMHAVVPAWCTGCELCVPVCPTDCIEMLSPAGEFNPLSPAEARRRFETRQHRATAGGIRATLDYVEIAEQEPAELQQAIIAAVRRKQGLG